MSSPFRIDVLDASGNVVSNSSGPIRNALQISTTQILDRIGSLNFTIPASDPKAALITAGRRFDIYDEVEGYLGRYIYRTHTISDTDGRGLLTVQCWDMLKELTFQVAGFGRNYSAASVESIITDLVGDVSPAWTLSIGSSLGTASVTYQGQTYYQAIEELAKRWGYHFRLNSTLRQLVFGAFGTVTANVRLTNLPGQDSQFDNRDDVAILKRITYKTITDEIYNRIIAVGAGEGAAQLRLLDGETGDTYTVQDRSPTYGQTETYIEDSTSQTAYGTREIVVLFDQIRPIANTATAKTQAQTELLLNAEKFLTRYKDPRVQIDNLEVYGLREDIAVGDLIPVRYKGLNEDGSLYVDVDADYWVTKKTTTREATGNRVTNLQVVNVDRPEMKDTDIMASAINAIRSQRLWIKPTAFRFENTYYDSAQYFTGTGAGKNASFLIDIDDTVTDVTRVVVRWKTYPLWNATEWYSWGPATVTAGTVPAQPTTSSWFLRQGALYPKAITMKINGTNVNNHADVDYLSGGTGAWNSGGANSAVTVEMDITDFILNAGIYNDFLCTFELGSTGSENIAHPQSQLNPINLVGGGSHGIFEFTVKMEGVAQAKYKD